MVHHVQVFVIYHWLEISLLLSRAPAKVYAAIQTVAECVIMRV